MSDQRNKKPVIIAAIVLVILTACCVLSLAAAAFLSYQTTELYWDGGYPSAEFRIRIENETGLPVEDACLEVYDETGTPALEYPIYEYRGPETLCSGAVGDITAHQPVQGIQFGGHEWYLFWFIPIGVDDGPQYDIEIRAGGYQTRSMDFWDLFDSAYIIDGPMTTFDWMGMEVEMEVYEIDITLEETP